MPVAQASAAVIAGFRAKYSDETTWQDKVEPYQERVLEKKRDALIDYLLHGPDAEFSDAREMYNISLSMGRLTVASVPLGSSQQAPACSYMSIASG